MSVKGTPQLRARMRAIKQTFKPVGKAWATDTVHGAQARVAVRTGATRRSIRIKNASMKRASVQAWWGARFIEGGTKAHDEKPRRKKVMRFEAQGTIFAKRVHHPATRAQPFLKPAAIAALEKNPMAAELIALWNAAA
jgi:hypothetical protein